MGIKSRILFAAMLLLSLSNTGAVLAAPNSIDYPILHVSDEGELTVETAFGDRFRQRLINRGQPEKGAPQQGLPEGERTQPYSPETAPKFEAPPADGTVPAPAGEATAEDAGFLEDAQPIIEQLLPIIIALFAGGAGASIPWATLIPAILGLFSKQKPATKAKVRRAVSAAAKNKKVRAALAKAAADAKAASKE